MKYLLALLCVACVTVEPETKRSPTDPLRDTKPARSVDTAIIDTIWVDGQLYVIDDPKPPKPWSK